MSSLTGECRCIRCLFWAEGLSSTLRYHDSALFRDESRRKRRRVLLRWDVKGLTPSCNNANWACVQLTCRLNDTGAALGNVAPAPSTTAANVSSGCQQPTAVPQQAIHKWYKHTKTEGEREAESSCRRTHLARACELTSLHCHIPVLLQCAHQTRSEA